MNIPRRFCLYAPPLSTITSYAQMIDFASAHGITQLETLNILDLSTPDPEQARKIRAYADEKGITVPCASLGLNLVGEDHAQALETAKQYVQIAAILGSPYFHHTICLEFESPKLVADNFDLFYERGILAVRELYDYAQSLGIRTIYEDQGFLFNGVENFSRFLRDVDRDVGVVADFGNIMFADEQIDPFIRAFASRIVHVHVKDYYLSTADGTYTTRGGNHLLDVPVGMGSAHLQEGFRALRKMGYAGSVSMETGAMGTDEEQGFLENLAAVSAYMQTYL